MGSDAFRREVLGLVPPPRPAVPEGAAVSLAATPPGRCLFCGAGLRRVVTIEPALLVHGGYGETRVTTSMVCDNCGASREESVTARRPDRRPLRLVADEEPWPSVDLGAGDA